MFRLFGKAPAEEKASKRTPIRLGMALIAVIGMLLAPLALAASASATVKPHATTVQGTYVSVTPFRIVDTRTGATDPATYAGQTLAAASTLNVQVTGVGTTAVPTGASAVVLNVTAVDPTASGYLTAFPEGTTQPTVSNLNFAPGVIVPNLVTVPLSATGGVSFYNFAGKTDIVVDVEGYYTATPATNGVGLFNPIAPVRVLGALASGAAIAANTATAVTVTGTATGIPNTASAVVANVTAAGSTTPSFVTVYPAGATQPVASNLNFGKQVANQAIANRVTVGVGTGGQIEVYNHTGSVNVDVDIDGYYTGLGGTGSVFVPITPIRVADTRTASLVGTQTSIAGAATEKFAITTAASNIPATATAVATNVTVVPGNQGGYLTVYPTTATTNPVASDVNWTASEAPAVANFTIADTAGTGSAEFYNSHGATVDVVVDAFGYFAASSAGPIMTSAAVTDTSITITYNEAVSCPTADASYADFVYDWTGTASGGAVGTTAAGDCTTSATNPDQLILLPAATFVLPGTGGGTIIYTAPTTLPATNNSVFETGTTTLAAAQSLAVTAASTGPAMVSSYTTGATLVITYNEDVSCAAAASADFAYDYTGSANGFVGAVAAACTAGSSKLTLTAATSVSPPGPGASIVYTAPTTNATTASVYATGSVSPVLYAATQTLSGSAFTAPSIQSAVVAAATITLTYNEAMSCPTPGTGADTDFVYDYTGTTSGGTFTGCSVVGADQLALAGAFTLPGASGGSIAYTSPATPTPTTAVFATLDFPAYPATQTLALSPVTAPTITAASVNVALNQIAITYSGNVSCATGVVADLGYYSTGSTSGLGAGTISASCATDVLTLATTTTFTAPTSSATIVYTAPGTPTAANAVSAAGTTVYAASQTFPFGIPFAVSAVVTTGTIAITWSQPVFCPATFVATDFVYDYTVGSSGGTATGCTSAGDVTTLAGAFNAPLGSASVEYTGLGSNINWVYANATSPIYAPSPQTISGTSIT